MTGRASTVEGGMYTLNAVSPGAAAGTAAIAAGIGRRCPHGRHCHRSPVDQLSFASIRERLTNGTLILKEQEAGQVTPIPGKACLSSILGTDPSLGFPFDPEMYALNCYLRDGLPGIGSKYYPDDFTPLHEVTALNSPACPEVPYSVWDYPVTKECIGQNLLSKAPSLVLWYKVKGEPTKYEDAGSQCARALANVEARGYDGVQPVKAQCSVDGSALYFGESVGAGRQLEYKQSWA